MPAASGTNTADVLIVGGGIHGASLAFHLAKRGLQPLVLERRFLAAGATGVSSGLVRMHYDLEPEARLAWASFQYFQNWAEMVGGECGFTRTGFIQIVRPEYEPRLQANVAMHRRIGVPAQVIGAADLRELATDLYSGDFNLAAWEPESGYADPSGTAKSLMDAARQHGARLVQDCQVTGIAARAGRASGVQTSLGDFWAPVVVNAAGAWAAEVGRMAGLELPVTTWKHHTLFVRRPAEISAVHPAVIDDINSMYLRAETGGLTLVGLEDGNPLGESPEERFDYAPASFIEAAAGRLCRRIPAMENGSFHSAQGGFDGLTPDQRPLIGQAGPEGFYLACGFSGTGFKIAPAVGACLAELIVDGQAVTADISPFRVQRFEEGAPLAGENAYPDTWR